MKLQHLILTALFAITSSTAVNAADPKKEPAAEAAKPKAKQDTYPLYGKVVAITSRTLTVIRSDAADAQQSKYTINAAVEYVDGEKPATIDAVKVGSWVGGTLKKAAGDGNDIVIKLNVGVKQKTAKKGTAPAKSKSKTAPKKKSE